ncbi:MAG: hypothetical protein RBT49_00725 [Bacteroidales bacterium]|jgi:hypothetical protein|nr:hypothetical protein [Bacteroidales bacterium]
MIAIKRNNYEQFFLDYLDGTLSKSEVNQLMSFLNSNPDLKKELDDLDFKKLMPDNSKFTKKSTLKKESILEESKNNNFNEICIASIEGDLNQFQSIEFDNLIHENPQLKKHLLLFEKTKLIPDIAISYNKKSLLRKYLVVPKQKFGYQYFSIAASVILLIALSFFVPKSIHENQNFNIVKSPLNKGNEVLVSKGKNFTSSTKTLNIQTPYTYPEKFLSEKMNNNITIIIDDKDPENRESVQPLFMRPINLETKKFNNNLLAVSTNQLKQQHSQIKDAQNYKSIKDVLIHAINKNVFKKDNELSKINTYDFANIAITGMNRLAGTKMSLNKKYDSSGNLAELEFNSRLIAFSTPVKN